MKRIITFFENLSLYNKVFLIIALSTLFVFNLLKYQNEQEYAMLARSFLHGQTNLPDGHLVLDTVLYEGRVYWPLGPFPSVLLIPFVGLFDVFAKTFPQGYLHLTLNLGVLLLCYKIARLHKYSQNNSLTLALAFCFASIYQIVGLHAIDGFFAHLISVFLILLSVYGFFAKKIGHWGIGIIYSFIFMTRFTAGIGIVFFLIHILLEKDSVKEKILGLLKILTPIMIAGIILVFYNFVRFDNPFDNGYTRVNDHTLTYEERYELVNYGLFQIRNIPTNFYYYFLRGLDPVFVDVKVRSLFGFVHVLQPPYVKVDYPGTSFFIVSPIFLYIFGLKKFSKTTLAATVAVLLTTFVLLTYYWGGWVQVGPRYLLDHLPFLFIILLAAFRDNNLSRFSKFLISGSSIFNFYLMLTVMLF